MKKETPQEWLKKRNEAAIASVPAQDKATLAVEEGIEAQRTAIAAAQKAKAKEKNV